MSYLLHVTVSPFGENSKSKAVGAAFVSAYQATHGDDLIITRDLDKEPIPHVDGECLTAGYLPEEARPESMQKKHQFRLDLIKELTEAKAIVISTPMWNWSIPSVFKAYIDHIVMVGVLDPYANKKLTGKSVTIIIASGSAYTEGSPHPEFDHEVPYLKFIFGSLGATDITVIRSEYTLAGVVPGMESLVDAKEASFEAAKAAAEKIAKAIE